eukprot:m.13793 g.13793  ORF g.13793 m.13793 type:complete len:72 (+) comp25230_c0_seq3:41-256(+)
MTGGSGKASDQDLYRRAQEISQNALKQKSAYRRRNFAVGGILLAAVAGIYAYTIMSVKQEAFLDEEFSKKE